MMQLRKNWKRTMPRRGLWTPAHWRCNSERIERTALSTTCEPSPRTIDATQKELKDFATTLSAPLLFVWCNSERIERQHSVWNRAETRRGCNSERIESIPCRPRRGVSACRCNSERIESWVADIDLGDSECVDATQKELKAILYFVVSVFTQLWMQLGKNWKTSRTTTGPS